MSISSEVRRAGPYSGNGSTTAFAFAFKVFNTSQVVVTRTVSGVETVLTLTTHYTVSLNSNQNTNPGGTVTLLSAPAVGQSITITSNVANLQPTAIANLGGFYPEVINDSLDRATIQIQQLDERLDRALVIPVSSSGISTQLPVPQSSKLIGWDSAGTALQNYNNIPVGSTVYQYVHRTIATAGQTAVALPITYTVGAMALSVFVNGLRVEQGSGLDYVETNNQTITFTSGLSAGDLVVVAIHGDIDSAATPPNYTIESIAALRLLTGATTATQLLLLWNHVAGDGGGTFRYDSTDTTTVDNGGTVIVDAAGRRWKRQWDETTCDARWFGNLATSFATAVQTALDLQPDGARRITVHLPPGTFSLATDLFIKRAAVLQGSGKDTCTINLSGTARIVIGGQASTTFRAGISDMLISAINAATTPALVFDRANDCFARRIIVANVDFEGVTLGTSANPGGAELNTLEEIRVLVDAANASGFRLWGGGANQFLSCDTQGTSGQGHTHININNTSAIDTIVIQLGGTGDCDYGLRWIGSANCSNVFATGSGQDRSASGALHIAPSGTASGSHWIFEGVWLSGVASTSGIDDAAVVISVGAGRSFADFKLSGMIGDSRKEQIRIEGAGTIANVCINGVVFTDGARAAANTYPAIRDATTSGVTRLRVSGCVFSATASTYSYCVRVDTAGTGTTLNDVVDNTFGGAATADVYFAGATYTGGAVSKRAALGLAATDSPEFAGINLGNASDTTLTRVSAGVAAVEGATIATLSGTQTFTGSKTFDTLRTSGLAASGASSAAIRGFAPGTVADDAAVSTTALSGGTNGVGFLTTSTGRYIFFAWECTGTPALYSISASANTALTTGILNGTTGVDGNTTLSIDTATRILYLENRAGATEILTLVLLGG